MMVAVKKKAEITLTVLRLRRDIKLYPDILVQARLVYDTVDIARHCTTLTDY